MPNVSDLLPILVFAAAYLIPWFLAPVLVNALVGSPPQPPTDDHSKQILDPLRKDSKRISNVIGRCENILTVTFVLMEQVTGLGIIIAAKALVRREAHPGHDAYYLGGTLINLAVGVVCAYAAKLILGI